jgi:hypothetical protein
LLTYSGENGPRETGDEEVARELGDDGSGASAPEMAQTAAVLVGGPPPSGGSSWEASTWWVVRCGKQGRQLGFDI